MRYCLGLTILLVVVAAAKTDLPFEAGEKNKVREARALVVGIGAALVNAPASTNAPASVTVPDKAQSVALWKVSCWSFYLHSPSHN